MAIQSQFWHLLFLAGQNQPAWMGCFWSPVFR